MCFMVVFTISSWPYVSQDLGDDGAAAVEYIMAKGVPEVARQ